MKKISYYRNKADKAFQTYITNKYPRCEMCCSKVSCGHHIITKGASSALRYEEVNMCPVCMGCHLKFHSKFSSEMIARLVLKRGEDWFNDLLQKKYNLVKPSKGYYEEIISKYELS
jgi:hypothetical protein